MQNASLQHGSAGIGAEQKTALFELAVSQHAAIFYIIDMQDEGELRYISPNVAQILGHRASTVISNGDGFIRYVHPEDRDCYQTECRALRRRKSTVCNYRLATASGDHLWVRDTMRRVSMKGKNTQIAGCMIAITSDSDRQDQPPDTVRSRSSELLNDALEAMSAGLTVWDADDRLLACNSRLRTYLGEHADIVELGQKWSEFADRLSERKIFDVSLGNPQAWAAERSDREALIEGYEFQLSDGRWFEYSRRPTRQGGIVAVWKDISERRALDNARRDNGELVRRVLEACPVPVTMNTIEDGTILYESPAARELLGYERPQDGKSVKDRWVDVKDREKYLHLLRKTRSVNGLEVRYRKAGGEEFPCAMSSRVIEFRGEEVIVSNLYDLSERKAMEDALRESEEHFRNIVEGHPLPVWMVDLETSEILYESPAAAKLMGRERSSKSVHFTLDHLADPAGREMLNRRLQDTGALHDVELEMQRSDGSTFWVSLNDRLVSFNGRKVSISSFIDLTERRRSESEMARQRELLHQSEKLSAMGELLAGVSHELNNPLSVLVGQAVMLKEKACDEKTAARAETIVRAADRCGRIVRTFLAMARNEQGALAPAQINALIENALEITGYSLRTAGIDVSLDLSDVLPEVTADSDQLTQVFTNLMVNAEHALREVGEPRKLDISSSFDEDVRQAVIVIEDNGPGVPDQARSRIFEPLFTTKEVGSGTGLGLALCHRIIEAHGGTIELDDVRRSGARFTIRLACDVASTPVGNQPSGAATARFSLKVLVIDDESDVGDVIEDVLTHDGHRVQTVHSALAGLKLIKQSGFDVVLCDVRMPGMDGTEFYRRLREAVPDQVHGLVFITGDTLSPRVQEFLDGTERPYLEKPISPNDLRDLIELLIRRRR